MATLILTVAGAAIGGPIGSSIGAIIGQQIDQNILFKPKGREGPRLQELAVQTSTYGSQIPRIYGRMRVAGTVVWATDLKESRSREGGGKGRPGTTIYSYSACFAVALSSRRIRDIGRIWADGKLFRGAAGDFKTDTRFSFHPGREDQAADALMASAETLDDTPAYRGLALAIFEDMDLSDYGNRIPSLSFEIIADDGLVHIVDIVDDVSAGRVMLDSDDGVIGYAAGGESRRSALEDLAETLPLSLSADPAAMDRIAAISRADADPAAAQNIGGDFVRAAGNRAIGPAEQHDGSASATARQLAIRYYDPSRDYQAGIQSAARSGAGRLAHVREFPATVAADSARAFAATGLWSEYDERSTLQLSLPLTSKPLRPAMLIECDGYDGLWRIRECEFRNGFVTLLATRASGRRGLDRRPAESGRSVADADVPAGPTRLMLFDSPFALDQPTAPAMSASLYAAAAGGRGWRNARLYASDADGAPSALVGQIPAPTVIGTMVGILAAASPALIDRINPIEVDLHHPEMTLSPADEAQLLAGRNVAAIGQEVVQFAEARPLGDGRFRLSGLLRGLGGTEAEIARHGAGEDFIFIDADAMLPIGAGFFTSFAPATFHALGRDDVEPVAATILSPGRAMAPWSPVRPVWVFQANGDLAIAWTRRSRAGMIWPDHVEVPLAEESEQYRLTLQAEGDGSASLIRQVTQSQVLIAVGVIAALLSGGGNSFTVEICQIGAGGLSEPLHFTIPT